MPVYQFSYLELDDADFDWDAHALLVQARSEGRVELPESGPMVVERFKPERISTWRIHRSQLPEVPDRFLSEYDKKLQNYLNWKARTVVTSPDR